MRVCYRIRERRKLQILESREKRKVEKPRLPRTAKKIQTKKMEAELGQLGVEIEPDDDVSFYCVAFCCLLVIYLRSTVFVSIILRLLSPRSFIWYQPMGDDARWLER